MSRLCAVYGILCEATGKWYVGASVDAQRRMKYHFYELRVFSKTGERGQMGEDFLRYGESEFIGVVLEPVENPKRLAKREEFWADYLDAVTNGYNEQAPGVNRHWGNGNG